MATAVGVLCARVRMEEKRLIEALAAAGVPARPLPPATAPLPVGPLPPEPPAVTAGGSTDAPRLIVDRCLDRAVAGAAIPLLRAMGTTVVDAGVAATGDRLAVARTLAAAGIPRPATMLVTSEAAGMAALRRLGYPATLFPLDLGASEMPIVDREIAEAVLEHRAVLGSAQAGVVLIQAGVGAAAGADIVVVGGRAVGSSNPAGNAVPAMPAVELAEATAAALGADVLGVRIVPTANGPVVWDVRPVPEFRTMTAIGEPGIAAGIAALVAAKLTGPVASERAAANGVPRAGQRREVTDGVAISA